MIGTAICGTCIDLTPRYKEYFRHPTANLTVGSSNAQNFSLTSITWPIDYPESNILDDITICENSPPVKNATEFYSNISEYVNCRDKNGNTVKIVSLNTTQFQNPAFNSISVTHLSGNGTFCQLRPNDSIVGEIYCDIIENPFVGEYFDTSGSHAAMFGVYLLLRTLWQIFISAAFSISDGTAMCLAKEHNGDYAMVLFWQTLSSVLAPLISGKLIQDSGDPNGKIA